MAALPRKEIIITAAAGIRIFSAHSGTSVIDPAPSRFLIQKLTYAAIDVVFAMSKNTLARRDFGISFLGLFGRDVEMPRQSPDIGGVYSDQNVAAAIGRAFIAIVKNL